MEEFVLVHGTKFLQTFYNKDGYIECILTSKLENAWSSTKEEAEEYKSLFLEKSITGFKIKKIKEFKK